MLQGVRFKGSGLGFKGLKMHTVRMLRPQNLGTLKPAKQHSSTLFLISESVLIRF